mmetsp:Transcript_20809/g.66886  ORF Transcript_20809/g.66886 Transcript_20809/m.66886 type:complete len:282 (-) Transcript_20809:72-917(-)
MGSFRRGPSECVRGRRRSGSRVRRRRRVQRRLSSGGGGSGGGRRGGGVPAVTRREGCVLPLVTRDPSQLQACLHGRPALQLAPTVALLLLTQQHLLLLLLAPCLDLGVADRLRLLGQHVDWVGETAFDAHVGSTEAEAEASAVVAPGHLVDAQFELRNRRLPRQDRRRKHLLDALVRGWLRRVLIAQLDANLERTVGRNFAAVAVLQRHPHRHVVVTPELLVMKHGIWLLADHQTQPLCVCAGHGHDGQQWRIDLPLPRPGGGVVAGTSGGNLHLHRYQTI